MTTTHQSDVGRILKPVSLSGLLLKKDGSKKSGISEVSNLKPLRGMLY